MNEIRPRPAFFIVCGDLVDAYPGRYPEIRARQIKDLKEEFARLDPRIAMICVCSDHDVGNIPKHKTIAGNRSNFGDDYFYFMFQGAFFIVLNSQFYEDSSKVPDLFEARES